jgi:hypothetical protein
MHFEFLVEEQSAEAALRKLVPRIVGPDVPFRIHPFQGRDDLLQSLPGQLRAYREWLPADWQVVVLVDRDGDDCRNLKAQLETIAAKAGFPASTQRGRKTLPVLNRISIEELEAWFFGDMDAITAVYPRVSRNLAAQARYRDPDAIPGGTWEALHAVLRKAGYHRNGLPKIRVAREISAHMQPDRNRSKSFQVFRDGLRRRRRTSLAATSPTPLG